MKTLNDDINYDKSIEINHRNLDMLLVFISQYYFKVPKDIRLNTSHYFIMKIPNKKTLKRTR